MSENYGQLTLYEIELENNKDVDLLSLSDVLTKEQVDTLITRHITDLVGTDIYPIQDMNTLVNNLNNDDNNAYEVIAESFKTEQEERREKFIEFSNEINENESENLFMLDQFEQQIDTVFDQVNATNSEISNNIYANFNETVEELNNLSTEFQQSLKNEEITDLLLSAVYHNTDINFNEVKTNITNRLINEYQVHKDNCSSEMTTLIVNELERVNVFHNTTFDKALEDAVTNFNLNQNSIFDLTSTQDFSFNKRFTNMSENVEETLNEAINAESNLQNLLTDYTDTIDALYVTTSDTLGMLDTSTDEKYILNSSEFIRISDTIEEAVVAIDNRLSTNIKEFENQFINLSEELTVLNTDLLDYEVYKAHTNDPVITGSLVAHDETPLEIGLWKIKSEKNNNSEKVDLKFIYNNNKKITFASFDVAESLGENPYDKMIAATHGPELENKSGLSFKYKFPNGKVDNSAVGTINNITKLKNKDNSINYILNIDDWGEIIPRPGLYYVYGDTNSDGEVDFQLDDVEFKMLQEN